MTVRTAAHVESPAPAVRFNYAMEGDHLLPGARNLRVMAAVDLSAKPDGRNDLAFEMKVLSHDTRIPCAA